jgi:predicted transcriptional regulator
MPTPEKRAESDLVKTTERDRLAWEAEMIAQARAELEAGLFIDESEVDAWIDSLGTDHELPVPLPRR